MCVIAVCQQARLSDRQVELMWDDNPKGGGIAWRERQFDEQGEELAPLVHWKKGLNKEQMVAANRVLELPFVLHFRVPSNGTSQSVLANHPFVVDEEGTTDFEGSTPGYVLFHNGFWGQWEDKIQSIAMNGYVRIPAGPWSDSRGLAWATHHLGHGFAEMTRQKICLFGPTEIECYGSWDFADVKAEDGSVVKVLVSNKGWERVTQVNFSMYGGANDRRHHGGQSNIIQLANQQPGGAAADKATTFPAKAEGVGGSEGQGHSDKESVQKAAEASGGGESKGRSTGVVGASAVRKCLKCSKGTAVLNWYSGGMYCYQCWSDMSKNRKPLVGMCQTCKVNMASTKTVEGEKWICPTCWETNGEPKFFLSIAGERHEVVH
jgi:hypothetical protein